MFISLQSMKTMKQRCFYPKSLRYLGKLPPAKYSCLQERTKLPLAAQHPSPQGFLHYPTSSDRSLVQGQRSQMSQFSFNYQLKKPHKFHPEYKQQGFMEHKCFCFHNKGTLKNELGNCSLEPQNMP